MFSKVTAIAVSGFLTWFLVAVKIIKFTTMTCIVVTLVCAAASLILYCREQKAGFECIPFAHLDLVYAEELLFFTAFLLWNVFWPDFIRQHMVQKNLWLWFSWKP